MFSFLKNKAKKISIVIIVYNRKEYIRECLDSVLNQKIDKEIICIDDCSTDGAYEILQEYEQNHTEIKLYRNEENLGTVLSRYNGLIHCTGEYMLFVDSDDIVMPNILEKLYDEAISNEADVLEFSSETDGSKEFKKLLKLSNKKITTNILDEYIERKITNQLWNKLVAKRVYKKTLKKLNPNLRQANYMDVIYFLYHFFSNTENLVSTETVGYFYYDNRGMTATMKWLEKYKEYCGFCITYRELLEVYGHTENIKRIWNSVCNQAVNAYLELSEEEKKEYEYLMYELMSEEGAELLIKGHLEQRRKKMKQTQRGVSMVSLVITIIVIIILAAVAFSGSQETIGRAGFAGYTTDIDSVRTAFITEGITTLMGEQTSKNNSVINAQAYNYLAKGATTKKLTDDQREHAWLSKSQASAIPCTRIEKEWAKEAIGIELPKRKVNTFGATGVEIEYFVTNDGIIFTWPPYYRSDDGLFYINDTMTVKGSKLTSGDWIISGDDESKMYEDEFKFIVGDVEIKVLGTGEEIPPISPDATPDELRNMPSVAYKDERNPVTPKGPESEEIYQDNGNVAGGETPDPEPEEPTPTPDLDPEPEPEPEPEPTPGTCCFVPGTQILVSLDGETKAIEDFKPGDLVVSYDVETGENYIAEVQHLIVRPESTNMVKVYLEDGSMVDMTDYHPLYTKDGWHSITNHNGYDTLVEGDIVKTDDGWSKVTRIELYVTDPKKTYNLAIKDFDEIVDDDTDDCFYANEVLAHNVDSDTCGHGSVSPI